MSNIVNSKDSVHRSENINEMIEIDPLRNIDERVDIIEENPSPPLLHQDDWHKRASPLSKNIILEQGNCKRSKSDMSFDHFYKATDSERPAFSQVKEFLFDSKQKLSDVSD